MKVLLFNGLLHKEGCTYTALSEVAKSLNNGRIETDIFYPGLDIRPCMACRACAKLKKCTRLCRKFWRIYTWFASSLCFCQRTSNSIFRQSIFCCFFRQKGYYFLRQAQGKRCFMQNSRFNLHFWSTKQIFHHKRNTDYFR